MTSSGGFFDWLSGSKSEDSAGPDTNNENDQLRLQMAQMRIDHLGQEVTKANKVIHHLKGRLSTFDAEIEKTREFDVQRISWLEESLSVAEERATKNHERWARAQSDSTDLHVQLSDYSREVTEWSTKLRKSKGETSEQMAACLSMELERDSIQAELKRTEEKNEKAEKFLKTKMEILEASLATARSDGEAERAEIHDLKMSLTTAQLRVGRLERQNETLEWRRAFMEEDLKKQRTINEQQRAEMSQTQHEKMQQQTQRQESELAELQIEHEKMKQHMQKSETEHNDMQQQLKIKELELKKCHADLAAAKDESAEKDVDKSQLTATLEEMHRSLKEQEVKLQQTKEDSVVAMEKGSRMIAQQMEKIAELTKDLTQSQGKVQMLEYGRLLSSIAHGDTLTDSSRASTLPKICPEEDF